MKVNNVVSINKKKNLEPSDALHKASLDKHGYDYRNLLTILYDRIKIDETEGENQV
jgi:hypothetical protein